MKYEEAKPRLKPGENVGTQKEPSPEPKAAANPRTPKPEANQTHVKQVAEPKQKTRTVPNFQDMGVSDFRKYVHIYSL